MVGGGGRTHDVVMGCTQLVRKGRRKGFRTGQMLGAAG